MRVALPGSRQLPDGRVDRARGRPRLDSLTGLRFLAALAVFGNHAGDVFVGDTSSWGEALQTGRAGVAFFFILSGFVLAWSGATGQSGAAAFYRRRVARIVPNHVVAWIVALLVVLAIEGVRPGAIGAVLSLLLLQAWSPDPAVHFAVNSVAWTLSCEMFFYLLFPLLMIAATRLRATWRLRLIAVLVATSFLIPVAARLLLADDTATWFVYVFPPARLPEFVIGILLALEVADRRLPRIPVAAAAGLVVLMFAVLWQAPGLLQPAALPVLPFALLIAACAQADLDGRRGVTSARWLVRLGEWSFALYLLHELVLRTAAKAVDLDAMPAPVAVPVVALLLAGSVAASAALYRVVERPAEARLRSGRRSTPEVIVGDRSAATAASSRDGVVR